MRYRKLGGSGIDASVVGLGAWVLGGGTVWGADPNDDESVRAIQASIDAGVNLIDTAPAYGFGRSERVVGRAIRGRRDKVIVATKCGLWWDGARGSYFCEFDGRPIYRSLRPDTIRVEVERSLERLGVECIDLYQTHWPSVLPEKTAIAETMGCLLKLKEQGKIRAIGVSNVSLEELKENCARGPVASDQLRYSLLTRDAEKDVLPWCEQQGVATLAYMPLEQGLLTGKVTMERKFAQGEFRTNDAWNPWFVPGNRRRVLAMLGGWKAMTKKYGCTLGQLVIAATLRQRGVTHVLCGARTAQQAIENARGGEIELEQADRSKIRADVEGLGGPQ